MPRLSPEIMETVLKHAIERDVCDDHPVIMFHDLSMIQESIDALRDAFPADALHTVAVKANPLPALLRHLVSRDIGAEVASAGELHLALLVGFPPDRIVFDSPVKTHKEIGIALEQGVHLNADNFEELDRIETLLRVHPSNSRIGLRINPQVGVGSIALTSVGGAYSKFGVPLDEFRDRVRGAFLEREWLTGLHVHVGSQGCEIDLLARGVHRLVELADEINAAAGAKRISWIDIGGGLPVPYREEDADPTFALYADRLRSQSPGVFDGTYRVITEFGRHIHANAGWTVSRVEYVKPSTHGTTVMTHVGADLLLRTCYRPEEWHHDIFVADRSGTIKHGPLQPYIIAGPLCFAGDIVERNAQLPEVLQGDFLLIRDTGAYTLAMWSRYNSRQLPLVVGYLQGGEVFEILKERESVDDVVRFWSSGYSRE